MANPASFLQHLKALGYHSRSDKHSNSLALAIVDDLIRHCPKIRDKASSSELVYHLNLTITAGTSEWNVDLVLGPPALESTPPQDQSPIIRQNPSNVEIAIELKSVMTEHRKAVKNRKRDLEAHHEHVHNYNNDAIAGGVLLINASPTFQSPLKHEPTLHRDPNSLVEHCLTQLRAVAMRGGTTGYGLEAKCAIIVNMDNKNFETTKYVERNPAPELGDPLHYDAFIRTICDYYKRRF